MDAHVRSVAQECTKASDDDRITFPEVVMKLIDAGVERYHADLVRSEKTYYMPNGEFEVVPNAQIDSLFARDFAAGEVAEAIRAIQAQTIKYRDFCDRIAAAGCVGYFVFLDGRRAVYYGRAGDTHVEHFPGID